MSIFPKGFEKLYEIQEPFGPRDTTIFGHHAPK